MKQFFLSFLTFCLFFVTPVYAQDRRGEGVGALLDRNVGVTHVVVTNGKTAPHAEVIVEDGEQFIHAVPELDYKGLFNFSFDTDRVGHLYIYAIDDLGFTNKVPIPGSTFIDEILPPTIAIDDADIKKKSVDIWGFSHPNAVISVLSTSQENYRQERSVVADGVTGKWRTTFSNLPSGNYVASARAAFEGKTSEKSQDVLFSIEGVVPVPQNLKKLVAELPESTTTALDITSKAALIPAVFVAAPGIFSLSNLWYYIVRLLIWLRGLIFIFRKKRQRWGLVYDSVTKQPIGGAIVRLYHEDGRLIETEVTSQTGTFSFLPVVGRYRLLVTKPGYVFPSVKITSRDDGEYRKIYRGEIISVTARNAVVNVSIPIDPKIRATVGRLDVLRQFIRRYRAYLEFSLAVGGLLFSTVSYISNPSILNQIILVFYGLMFFVAAIKFLYVEQQWGVVVDELGHPVASLNLSLLEMPLNRLVQRRVTDRDGRYQFVAPKGDYILLVTSEEWALVIAKGGYDGSTLRMKSEHNVVKKKIVVRKRK